MNKGKYYPLADKIELMAKIEKLYIDGMTREKAAQKAGITKRTFYVWRLQLKHSTDRDILKQTPDVISKRVKELRTKEPYRSHPESTMEFHEMQHSIMQRLNYSEKADKHHKQLNALREENKTLKKALVDLTIENHKLKKEFSAV